MICTFTDDLVVLAPNRAAAEQMLAIFESWALENGPKPRESKSKIIYLCGQNTGLAKPSPLFLNGSALPWVRTATHLGHEFEESGTIDQDIRIQRAQFISNSLEMTEVYSFANPIEILKAMTVYTASFYGSNLWELGSMMARQVYSDWGIVVRLAWSEG